MLVFGATMVVYGVDRLSDLALDEQNVPGRAEFIRRYGVPLFASGVALYLLAMGVAVLRGVPMAELLWMPPVAGAVYSLRGLQRRRFVKDVLVGLGWAAVPAGVRVMSMDMLTKQSDDPAILRGLMVNQVMMNFIEDVEWGRLDFLLVDLPPGTGDASLNLLQTLPVTGVVIVTTPQEMAVADARRGLRLFEKHDTPILGLVENMSGFVCPSCDDHHDVFGSGTAQTICEDYDVDLLSRLPVHPGFDSERVDGPAIRDEQNAMRDDLQALTERVADRIGEVNRRQVATYVPAQDAETVPSEPASSD